MTALGLPALLCLIGPGYWLARRWAWPHPWISGAALSGVAWFHLVLAWDTVGGALTRGAVAGLWGGLVLVSVAVATRWPSRAARPTQDPIAEAAVGPNWPWVVCAVLGMGSIVLRAWVDPASGWDNSLRWLGLSRAIVEHQTLSFYPATTTADFERVGWPDGIPPLVSLLNVWFHFWAGGPVAASTRFLVIGQALMIAATLGALARRQGGPRAVWPTLGLWSSSALALWSVAMGQETGLLTWSLLGVLLLLPQRNEACTTPTLLAAATLAAIGGLSREYGLAFGGLGLVLLIVRRRPRREWLIFSGVWAVLVVPWYLRVWLVTGNPLHPMGFAGLFPRPVAFDAMAGAIAAHWNWAIVLEHWRTVLPLIVIPLGVVLLVAGAFGLGRRTRATAGVGAAIVLMVLLWAWSVPQTAGGIGYSLRVLSPAVALLALAAAGGVLTLNKRVQFLVAGVTVLFAFDASKRAWVMPWGATTSPTAPVLAMWQTQRGWEKAAEHDDGWREWIAPRRHLLTIVDSSNSLSVVRHAGGRAAMLFSPAFAAAFDATLPPHEALRELRAQDITFLLLTLDDPVTRSLYERAPFLRHLIREVQPFARVHDASAFDLTTVNFEP